MTPKYKAVELRNKFRIFVGTSKGDEGETINNYLVGKKEARLGAIILCDEIIKDYGLYKDFHDQDVFDAAKKYWENVKTEIENL